jgi:hypothetical protein
MSSGNAGTGTACTAAFLYTAFLADDHTTAGYSTLAAKQRWCRWCNSAANGGINEVYLKDYVPPTTSKRVLKGITVFGTTTAGAFNAAVDATETLTKQDSVIIASSGCGKSGQTTKKSTKGQTVEFTIKSPVPLAAGQFVLWEDVTNGGAKNWQLAGSIPANSVSCTCGTHTWTATFAKASATLLKLTMPNAASGATSEVICAKGDLSCKVREWTSGSGTVTEMTATCYACDSASGSCTKSES